MRPTKNATKAEARVNVAELAAKKAIDDAQVTEQDAQRSIIEAEKKCELLISNAKSEAIALVDAANRRADKAEQESAGLREQVRLLTIDQAKREIEQAQHEKTLEQHEKTLSELAAGRTLIVQLQTQEESRKADVLRLTQDLSEYKADSKALAAAQGQLVELQKQVSQLTSELSLSERERESLTMVVRSKQ